jgi:DNA-directed RNA polymerase subunit N (RpoN/RPB10)
MLIPCVCFTCGYPIGDVDDLFRTMRARRAEQIVKERKTAPSNVAFDVGLQIDCSDIFDSLNIRHDCCRKSLASAMRFSDYY